MDVTIGLEGGGELTAAAAIVALPLNVWDDVAFAPALATPKQRAARERQAGASTKVLAVIDGGPANTLGLGWGSTFQGVVSGKPAPGGRVVTGFASRDRLATDDPEAVARAFHAYLPETRIVASDSHDWVADPFAKGTWLANRPGWIAEGVMQRLREPEDRVVFAGSDVAEEGAGWIEGAVASGKLAAAEAERIVRP
jgi:monoamine oxidase